MQTHNALIGLQYLAQFSLSFHLLLFYYNANMNQRYYSPDQLTPATRPDSSHKNSKKLREGGSTTKLMESTSRYC